MEITGKCTKAFRPKMYVECLDSILVSSLFRNRLLLKGNPPPPHERFLYFYIFHRVFHKLHFSFYQRISCHQVHQDETNVINYVRFILRE